MDIQWILLIDRYRNYLGPLTKYQHSVQDNENFSRGTIVNSNKSTNKNTDSKNVHLTKVPPQNIPY